MSYNPFKYKPKVNVGDLYDTFIGDPAHNIQTGAAEIIYDTLDPYYGEGGTFEDVTTQVREGDIVGAVLETGDAVFVDPVTEYAGKKYEELKDEYTPELIALGAAALLFLTR